MAMSLGVADGPTSSQVWICVAKARQLSGASDSGASDSGGAARFGTARGASVSRITRLQLPASPHDLQQLGPRPLARSLLPGLCLLAVRPRES